MTIVTRVAEYIKLEKRLVLLAWLNNLFAYKSNQELLSDMREADEGFESAGPGPFRPGAWLVHCRDTPAR